ncbi:hypothetical protein CDCA_CDCA04G1171 [Cyanidium caldarium]|uniref:Probable ATP-dependent transporter ycf16 n=1 Tax=Cyanidium caldarium TaxID=2771 RepID=A0AAV9ISJ4_CYACA|nr:hypothetical protein CDCA_CDCA04G1171 [Cyanidium caldarium]
MSVCRLQPWQTLRRTLWAALGVRPRPPGGTGHHHHHHHHLKTDARALTVPRSPLARSPPTVLGRRSLYSPTLASFSRRTVVTQNDKPPPRTDSFSFTASAGDESTTIRPDLVSLRRLFQLTRPHARILLCAVAAQTVSALSTMAFPMAVGKMVDAFQAPDGLDQLRRIALLMGGVFAVGAVAVTARVALLSIAGERTARSLRKSLFQAILRQDTAFFDARPPGELVNRLSADASAVSKTLTDNVARGIRASITTVSAASFLLYLSPQLTTVSLAMVPGFAAGVLLFGRYARRLSRQLLDALASATQVAAERIAAIRTVRLFAAEQREAQRYAHRIDASYALARQVSLVEGAYMGFGFLTAQASLLGVLWYGGTMVMDGALTVGALTSFAMYAVNLGVGITSFSSAVGQLLRAQGAGARIFELLDRQPSAPSVTSGAVLPVGYAPPSIAFQRVHFAYPLRPQAPVLRGLDLVVERGEICAIVGGSGTGKSTLYHLLARLYDPQQGEVRFGGSDVRQLDPHWLRRQLGVVPQEPVLFAGSIADNIRYARAAVSRPDTEQFVDAMQGGSVTADATESLDDRQRLEGAARAAGAHPFITALPHQYDTMIGERGSSLSGGQVQRLALARALYHQPACLALDEFTSALDPETEQQVVEQLERLVRAGPCTALIITHRVPLLRLADRVAVLANGICVEHDSMDALMSQPSSLLRKMVLLGGGGVDGRQPLSPRSDIANGGGIRAAS